MNSTIQATDAVIVNVAIAYGRDGRKEHRSMTLTDALHFYGSYIPIAVVEALRSGRAVVGLDVSIDIDDGQVIEFSLD